MQVQLTLGQRAVLQLLKQRGERGLYISPEDILSSVYDELVNLGLANKKVYSSTSVLYTIAR